MEQIFENIPFTAPSIVEAKGALKEGVLSVVKGPSFFSDGYSRNGRFYPKALWENALKLTQTKEAISRGLMFGCIGHPKDYSLDELLESGKVSHKVTEITIDPKTGDGVATYEILDTPAGRILDTIIKSGSEMYVSTRAFGGFTNETKKKGGKEYKVLDSKNFELESIDFVIQPGFLQTNPKLVESIESDLESLFEDKAKIQCSEGICQLREDLKSLNESADEPTDMFEGIDDLEKDDIIAMLRNVVAENKMLSADDVKESAEVAPEMSDEAEIDVNAKLLSNYVSYVELLTKIVRYNVEFNEIYDSLIEFLDKDSKVTQQDVDGIAKICEDIMDIEDLDESISVICQKVLKLTGLLANSTDEEKEAEASESVAEVVAALIFRPSDKFAMVEVEAENETLKSQIARLKQATLILSESTMKTETVEVPVETVVEKEVFKTPKEITEKLVSLTADNKRLLEELSESRESMVDDVESSHTIIEELSSKVSELEDTITENSGFAKEALLENKSIIKGLREQLSIAESDVNKATSKVDKMADRNAKLYIAKEQAEIAFESSVYRLDKQLVAQIFEKYTKYDDRKRALEKEAKLQRKSVTIVEDVPEYTPKKKGRVVTSRLENLMK